MIAVFLLNMVGIVEGQISVRSSEDQEGFMKLKKASSRPFLSPNSSVRVALSTSSKMWRRQE